MICNNGHLILKDFLKRLFIGCDVDMERHIDSEFEIRAWEYVIVPPKRFKGLQIIITDRLVNDLARLIKKHGDCVVGT